jgi:hypothetical protein
MNEFMRGVQIGIILGEEEGWNETTDFPDAGFRPPVNPEPLPERAEVSIGGMVKVAGLLKLAKFIEFLRVHTAS